MKATTEISKAFSQDRIWSTFRPRSYAGWKRCEEEAKRRAEEEAAAARKAEQDLWFEATTDPDLR